MNEWYESPLNFLGLNAIILAFFSTLVIFINQYLPMGSVLIADIKGYKLLIVMPVLMVLAFCFFALTFLVAAGCMLAGFLGVFFLIAGAIHFLLVRAVNNGKLFFEMLKAAFYSSRVTLFLIFPLLTLILVKKGLLSFFNFVVVFDIAYLVSVWYLLKMLSCAADQIYRVERRKVRMALIAPIVLLIIAGIIFSLKVLPKLAPLIT